MMVRAGAAGLSHAFALLPYPEWFTAKKANWAELAAIRERWRDLPVCVEFRSPTWLASPKDRDRAKARSGTERWQGIQEGMSPAARRIRRVTSRPIGVQRSQEARRFADLVHGRLIELGQTVGVAESLTGGLICGLLTEAPGTSVTFRGGLVVYATDLKHSIVGVPLHDLEQYGPVPRVVAEQLASGARERLQADYGIGATGVAGPGGQNDREVGEVFIAVASEAGVSAKRYEFDGNRDEIRITTVTTALADLVDVLNGTVASA